MDRRNLLKFSLAVATTAIVTKKLKAANAELIIGCDTSFMPFEFKQGDTYVGFDIDLWTEIANGIGRKWRLQSMDFTGLIPALQTKNIDAALACMTIREDRRRVIDFSDPYYDSGLTALVKKGAGASVRGAGDLNGKRIGAKTGTATIDFLKSNIKELNLQQFPNIDNALLELQAGRVDAVVHNTPNMLYYATTVGKGIVDVIEPPLQSGSLAGIGFPKGSDLVAPVNVELARIKKDGRYADIYRKWFSKEPDSIPPNLTSATSR